jgi:acetoin utilization protein AcuB
MKVKHWMTPDPITAEPDMLVVDAKKIMKDNNIRRLPVVRKGRLVGLITRRNIMEASPSAATSLSVHELNYLILKLTVSEVMRKNPVTVSPDDSVIDVILQGAKKGIGAFPVVESDRLVGIITETEVFRAMLHIFGTGVNSEIITLDNPGSEESIGDFRRIAEILEGMNVPIGAIFALPMRDVGGHQIYIRVRTRNVEPVYAELEKHGFKKSD